jgi:hypothetical protein
MIQRASHGTSFDSSGLPVISCWKIWLGTITISNYSKMLRGDGIYHAWGVVAVEFMEINACNSCP